MAADVIQLEDIKFRYKGDSKDILNIPRLEVSKGEHLFIQGSSGTGKSTFLNLLSGIHRPRVGSVKILNEDINRLSHSKRDKCRADHFGIIFQQFNLLSYLTVIENVLLACRFSKRRVEKAENPKEAAKNILGHLGIPEDAFDKPSANLSVGQQQRVAAARALIGRPEIVLADEPTSALDSDNRDRFLELLFQEAELQDSTIIYVSHDRALASKFKKVVSMSELSVSEDSNIKKGIS